MAYIVAFYVNFGDEIPSVPQKDTSCRGQSQYHRSIISNTLLLGLSTHLVAVATIRRFSWNPVTGLVRGALAAFVVYITIVVQAGRSFPCDPTGYRGQACSADPTPIVLLPLVCTAPLSGTNSTTYYDIGYMVGINFGSLSPSASHPVQNAIQVQRLTSFILIWYILLAVAEILIWFRLRSWGNVKARLERLYEKPWFERFVRGASSALTLGSLLLGFITIGVTYSFVSNIRSWLRDSGWAEIGPDGKTAEDTIAPLGQALAIFALVAAVWTLIATSTDELVKVVFAKRYRAQMAAAQPGNGP